MTDRETKDDVETRASSAPVLMLDTGGHTARITEIAFTPDGKQLVSASDDKTIRVWDLTIGKTVRTLRGEIEPGPPGKIFAMALSPDGEWLAAGGSIHQSDPSAGSIIRLYDFASGRLVALLQGHENTVSSLAFSFDGRHLISGSFDAIAILWDVKASRILHRLIGHEDHIYAVLFSPDGERIVTGSHDHDLRLWCVSDGGEIAHMTGHTDKVCSIAVAQTGTIVSGDISGEIRLWDGRIGAFRETLARQGTEVRSLSVSPDGFRLLSGVGPRGTRRRGNCHVYDLATGRKNVTYSGHDNIVIATAISLDGRWAATGGGNDHQIHLWDLRTGERRLDPHGEPLTLGGQGGSVWAVGFSADGRRICWGQSRDYQSHNDRGQLQHVLTLPSNEDTLPRPQMIGRFFSWWERLTLQRREMRAFRRSITDLNGWSLSHRKGGNYGLDAFLDIKHRGRVVGSIERGGTDDHRAYGFSPDGGTIISGGAYGVMTAYDRHGKKLGAFIGHEGDVWAIASSPDGRFLVSGSWDQTVRLWNLNTRELLVTLFHGSDGEWVMWTPHGYYISSLDGDRLIGWQINRGPENAADYVRASQLSGKLFRPDIVARTIELASAEAALTELGAPANVIDLLRVSRPPEFRILRPETGSTIPDTPASVVVEVSANPDPVEGYDITVNGRQVATRDLHLHDFGDRPARKTLPVPLEQGDNAIRILARNRIGTAERELLLRFLGQSELTKRGTLYVVAVGVDVYTNAPHNALRFAGADARAFCETMLRHVAPMHERAECLLLAKGGDKEPTRANIENAMLLFRKAEPQDTVVLFLAGHGVNDGANYVFLPQDVAADGTHYLPATVVRWLVFQEALQAARGRRLMFVDTCHSGGAYNARLVKDAHDASIIVFSATDSATLALELADIGHGAFTFALIQGLAGEADVHRQGEVELFALQSYVSREVRNLTNRRQAPAIHLSGVTDFVIARR